MARENFDNFFLDDLSGLESMEEFENRMEENPEEHEQDNPEEQEEEQDTEESNPLLDDDPESVGDEDNNEEGEDASKQGSTTPVTFSSIADAFAEEGIFPDLTEEEIASVKTAADFVELMKKQMNANLDEKQKRISRALDAGVPDTTIQRIENTLDYLQKIDRDALVAENEQAENLRKQILLNDFLNKGLSKEKAAARVERAVKNGTDVDDVLDALDDNISYYTSEYNKIVEEEENKVKESQKLIKQRAEALKKDILENDKLFGTMTIPSETRKQIYKNISTPVWKDENGVAYTALQKYQKENPDKFLSIVGTIFTMTEGFQNIDKFAKTSAKPEIKSKMKDLEKKLNGTMLTSEGAFDFLGLEKGKTKKRKFILD